MLNDGVLKQLVEEAVQRALISGSLLRLETTSEVVEDRGIPFVVRVLSSRLRKEEMAVFQSKLEGGPRNPFLPYDPDLFVADLSKTHLCLLNKYNVVDQHLLMVTREFEAQYAPLSTEDFGTVSVCLRELDGLAFYNSDETAGASQSHKHLQFVPFSSDPVFGRLPIETVLHGEVVDVPFALSRLPFPCGLLLFENPDFRDLGAMTGLLQNSYSRLAGFLGGLPGSHNLLVTRKWMMVVPRRRESFRSISVNSLGYAGSLLAKNVEEMDCIKQVGPIEVLRHCAACMD